MADDLITALRGLANKWALKARDYARDAKAEGIDADAAGYNRGFAEGYYRAATELAELIKGQSGAANRAGSSMQNATPSRPASPPPPAQPSPPASQQTPARQSDAPNPNAGGRWNVSSTTFQGDAPPPVQTEAVSAAGYVAVELSEVLIMLQYAGTTPRDVQPKPDNSYRAIFSRWENMTPPERVAKVQKADFRLVILDSGFTKDTRDPYIDFAFKQQP